VDCLKLSESCDLFHRSRVCENLGKKPQVPPLRFAPVGMTILLQGQAFPPKLLGKTELSSRPERSAVEGPAVSFPSTQTPSVPEEGTHLIAGSIPLRLA